MTTTTLTMDEVCEHPRIKPVARRVVLLGALIILLDGFDTQAIGFAATALSRDLSIEVSQLGIVFSAALIGALIGALVLSPLADRFGRKPIILLTVGVFGLFTLLTVFATSLEMLCVLRLLAGIGLGGAIPNVISHCVEYVPPRRRGWVVGLLYAGFPAGGLVGASVSALILPVWGWKPLFVIGGLLPLAIIPLVLWLSPESLQFLAAKPQRAAQLRHLLQRLLPGVSIAAAPPVEAGAARRSALSEVFAAGGIGGSVLLWIPFFMILLLLVTMVLWTPTLLQQSGMEASRSVLVVGLINLGSALGNLWAGRMIDRFGPFRVVPSVIVAGAACLAPMGSLLQLPGLLAACAIGAGFFIGASGAGIMTLSAAWYPAHVRATGFGWAYSVGRLGQLVGPLIPGGLLALGLGVPAIFLLTLVPAVLAAVAVLLLRTLPRAATLDRQRQTGFSMPQTH